MSTDDEHVCGCGTRGRIKWRDGYWCDRCFKAEAESRGEDDYQISRVLGVHDETNNMVDAENIDLWDEKPGNQERVECILIGLMSPREREIYLLQKDNLSNQEIATELDIKKGTVRGQLQRIRQKRRKARNLDKRMSD